MSVFLFDDRTLSLRQHARPQSEIRSCGFKRYSKSHRPLILVNTLLTTYANYYTYPEEKLKGSEMK